MEQRKIEISFSNSLAARISFRPRNIVNVPPLIPALVVSDPPEACASLAAELHILGFVSRTVSEIETAIVAFQETYFPLVIATSGLGNLNGLELCRAIRKLDTERQAILLV